ncbi:DUF5659 domain-containing protein [Paenibacillus odorifer]|uniref:DUF5659 domain-containing protein n=1 Tax=Paenibacillus odorifer TaxID=189426 RepID=UPI0015C32A3B|nr:DUF5659 domain-containing protein [Paenibacillus odorifer]
MKKQVYIHSVRMAGWIMFNGIMCSSIIDNKKYANKKVFVFAENKEIFDIMSLLPAK